MRVAHANLLPPFSEVKDGRSVGLVVDILRAAVERAGGTIELVPMPFDETVPALSDGRAEVAIPIAVTPDRQLRLDFSETLLMSGGALFVRAPEPWPDSLAALAGKRVVTPSAGPLAAIIAKTAPEVKLVEGVNYEQSLAKLMRGEAEAAGLNFQTGARLAAQLHPGKITPPRALFLELPLAAAFLKNQNAGLRSAVDRGLAAIRADGTLDRINREWVGA